MPFFSFLSFFPKFFTHFLYLCHFWVVLHVSRFIYLFPVPFLPSFPSDFYLIFHLFFSFSCLSFFSSVLHSVLSFFCTSMHPSCVFPFLYPSLFCSFVSFFPHFFFSFHLYFLISYAIFLFPVFVLYCILLFSRLFFLTLFLCLNPLLDSFLHHVLLSCHHVLPHFSVCSFFYISLTVKIIVNFEKKAIVRQINIFAKQVFKQKNNVKCSLSSQTHAKCNWLHGLLIVQQQVLGFEFHQVILILVLFGFRVASEHP